MKIRIITSLFLLAACSGDKSISAPVPSPTPAPSASLPIEIASFSVLEIGNPSTPNSWSYSPQIRVRELTNAPGTIVTRIALTIPGLGATPPCNTATKIPAGDAFVLAGASYGDYDLEISGKSRSTGGQATLVLNFTDSRGAMYELKATAPIVSAPAVVIDTPSHAGLACF